MQAHRRTSFLKALVAINITVSAIHILASGVNAQAPAASPVASSTPGSPSTTGVPGARGSKPKKPYVFNIPNMLYVEDLPTNFPIPPYTSNIIKKCFVSTAKGAAQQSATENITTRDKAENVYNWYKNICQNDGWAFKTLRPERSGKYSKNGPIYIIEGSKGRQNISIFCLNHPKDQTTLVSINWNKSKAGH